MNDKLQLKIKKLPPISEVIKKYKLSANKKESQNALLKYISENISNSRCLNNIYNVKKNMEKFYGLKSEF